MSKKPLNQLYIDQADIENGSIDKLLLKTIGRKRSGVVRLQYINGVRDVDFGINAVASVLSYKFNREMESTEHQIGDRPYVEDLLGADLPWKGLVKSRDERLDERYRIEGIIRPLVEQDDFVFMLRDTTDGSPWTDGLTVFTIDVDSDTGSRTFHTKSGLKQMEVITLFQGYFESLERLYVKLEEIGYVRKPDGSMDMFHNGELVSNIDVSLVGVRVFNHV